MKSTDILNWVAKNPTRDGGSWNGWDGSMLFRLGVAPPEINIYRLLDIARLQGVVNKNWWDAPVGAVHFFDTAHDMGHAAVQLYEDTEYALTTGVLSSAGLGLGVIRVSHQARRTPYIGWYLFPEAQAND